MPSITELMDEISAIKNTSVHLSTTVMAAGQGLAGQGNVIAALVRGSRTGLDAASAVRLASHALTEAAASMNALSNTCDTCVQDLSK